VVVEDVVMNDYILSLAEDNVAVAIVEVVAIVAVALL